LPADHSSVCARSLSNRRKDIQAPLGFNRDESERLKRERQQRVARKNCDRIAENFVARGLAASKIIIVERGKIIVNQ
jgi:hypothetical protein